MNITTRLSLIFLLSLPSALFAQINESDTLKFRINSRFSGNYQQGNVELLIIRGSVDFTFRASNSWVVKSQNSQLYQEFSGFKADNDIFSRNYLYFKPENLVYPFGIAYISTNFRRKIELRYFTGAGITYRPVSTEAHVVKFAINTVYERSRFDTQIFNETAYNNTDVIDLWRGTVYVGGWSYLLNDRVRLSYEAFYQPAFTDNDNYRAQLDFKLDFPIYKGFYLTSEYEFTHENVVPLGTQQDDSILTFGIGYGFKGSSFK